MDIQYLVRSCWSEGHGKPFDFYSFTGYSFLISTIQFLLVKMIIPDINYNS